MAVADRVGNGREQFCAQRVPAPIRVRRIRMTLERTEIRRRLEELAEPGYRDFNRKPVSYTHLLSELLDMVLQSSRKNDTIQ